MPPTPQPDSSFTHALLSSADQLGLTITPDQLSAYLTHFHLLLTHNPRAGLTTITEPGEVAIKHFLDSLTVLLVREIAPAERVADVGSGGGFPGLVLAIARPSAHYTLIESVRKRADFLCLAARQLGLSNLTVLHTRAELAGQQPPHRAAYHLVVSRAVAPLPRLLKYCLPLLRPGGHLIAYKGPSAGRACSALRGHARRPPGADEGGSSSGGCPERPRPGDEIASASALLTRLRARIVATHPLNLPHNMGARTLVVIEKQPL